MIENERLAVQLITMWVERPAGVQESFGYVISTFLKEHAFAATYGDIREVLSVTKTMAGKIIMDHPHDVALHLSHRAFSSALDSFISYLN